MNLTVLGATGRTGREVVGQALDAGHRVTVVEDDARDPSAVARVVAGADAVLSARGHVHGSSSNVLSVAAASVVAANARTRRYRAGVIERTAGRRIARPDVADFMLTVATSESHIRRMPFVSE